MANMENIVYDIETHPYIVAIVIFAVLFIGFDFLKKPGSSSTAVDTSTPKPTTLEYYNQTYNSYPTMPKTVPPPVNVPPTNNKTVPLIPYNYFPSHTFPVKKPGTNIVVDSIQYGGMGYKVIAGNAGRIWGVPFSGSTQEVLLYAPKSYYQ